MNDETPGAPTEPASHSNKVFTAFALLITAGNAFVAYHGWSSAKEIMEVAAQAKETAAQVKEKQKEIDQILEGSYFLYVRAVEREITELFTEIPGFELSVPRTKEIKDAIRKVKDNLNKLETSIKSENQLPTRHLIDGFIFLDEKNCEGAIQSLNLYSKEISVKYHLLGIAHVKCDHLDRSDAAYEKELELSPSYRLRAKVMNNLGNNESRRNKLPAALSRYEQALKIDPAAFGVYYNKAAVFSRMGRYSEALKSLCKYDNQYIGSISTDVDHDKDFDALKNFLAKDGSWATALASYLSKCH